jgi:hypothetical protein
MADRTGIYCPLCEQQGVKAELLRGNPELHLFRCISNHALTYGQLYGPEAQFQPTMIKMVVPEKPAPTDIQATVWLNPGVWQKFCEKYPNQKNATINSILALLLDDDLVIVSGEQARKLKKLDIKNGADMVANAEENQRLTGENADLVKDNSRFYQAVTAQMTGQAEAQ